MAKLQRFQTEFQNKVIDAPSTSKKITALESREFLLIKVFIKNSYNHKFYVCKIDEEGCIGLCDKRIKDRFVSTQGYAYLSHGEVVLKLQERIGSSKLARLL